MRIVPTLKLSTTRFVDLLGVIVIYCPNWVFLFVIKHIKQLIHHFTISNNLLAALSYGIRPLNKQ